MEAVDYRPESEDPEVPVSKYQTLEMVVGNFA